ncbi:MAG: hypothetical protein ACFHVJ_08080 [Aestuariibacter sp.]
MAGAVLSASQAIAAAAVTGEIEAQGSYLYGFGFNGITTVLDSETSVNTESVET